MQVTDVRVRMVSKDSKMKAVVSVTFDNELILMISIKALSA